MPLLVGADASKMCVVWSQEGAVRLAAVSALLMLYKDSTHVTGLRDFKVCVRCRGSCGLANILGVMVSVKVPAAYLAEGIAEPWWTV
jgi:hypothetical protein